jgi:hypothetical protein
VIRSVDFLFPRPDSRCLMSAPALMQQTEVCACPALMNDEALQPRRKAVSNRFAGEGVGRAVFMRDIWVE